MDVAIFKREGMRVIDVLRGDESLRRSLPRGDARRGRPGGAAHRDDRAPRAEGFEPGHAGRPGRLARTTTVEALISPDCRLVGRSLGSLRLRRRYGVYPLAVHRRNRNIGRQLDEVVVRVGDTLLLEGAPEDIRRLAAMSTSSTSPSRPRSPTAATGRP
jgi:hypothetical protein